jgi:hypothetical protein
MRQDPKAVVLDLMNLVGARERLAGRSRQARLEAGEGLLGTHSAPEFIHGRRHRSKDRSCRAESSLWLSRAGDVQLFNFRWLVRSDAGSLFLLFTDSLPTRLS